MTRIMIGAVAVALFAAGTAWAQGPVPAEIQPNHPGAPQAATPTPLPEGSADTPGGAAQRGVIRPPSTGNDPGINRGAPAGGTAVMPIIPPPGSPGGNTTVVPK